MHVLFIKSWPSNPPSNSHYALTVYKWIKRTQCTCFIKLLSFCFSLPNWYLKCFAWTNLIILSLDSCSNFTSIDGIPVDSMWLVSIIFFCLIYCNKWVFSFKIRAKTFFIFSSLIFFHAVVTVDLVWWYLHSLQQLVTSGSHSLTSAEICFGHWSSGWLRNIIPLNHLCDLLDLIASRPLELSSAGLYAVGT